MSNIRRTLKSLDELKHRYLSFHGSSGLGGEGIEPPTGFDGQIRISCDAALLWKLSQRTSGWLLDLLFAKGLPVVLPSPSALGLERRFADAA